MDNLVLRSALVAQHISNSVLSDYIGPISEWASSALVERQTFNIDRRTVAVGGSEEVWLHDLMANPTTEWFSMIMSMNNSLEMMVTASKPRSFCA